MKTIFHFLIGLAFLALVVIGYVYIGLYLGIKVPYYLWTNGYEGFAIVQAIIIWSWIIKHLGGKKK